MAARAIAALGRIDILVNNAAIFATDLTELFWTKRFERN
jgi:NAD(P)-dependent dehydrogenase (short-subunit alcohol dehydrogenase family)